ncbi:MAG: S-methyl-5-thioribose-1-phosphate isomerase, partial [Thermoplasmata archaeon]|nr:S-methyl-5-thioribose-1-phosphate isomerase [Thermoplasmata archaeon]
MIKTISWKNNTVVLIDQNALPSAERYVTCKSYKEVISSIKDLTVRGAPAIGVATAMGAALGALHLPPFPPKQFQRNFFAICNEIAKARPTARNLFWALERMKKHFDQAKHSSQRDLVKELVNEAKRICLEDIEINRQMGKQGSKLLANGDNILTHCNAGALATAGYGT